MEFDVVILPSFSQVEAWRKRAAGHGGGLFGCTVTTFDAWVSELWELHGDGRKIVDGVKREVMMHALCRQQGGALAMPGVAPMAAACMRLAAGTEELDAAIGAVARDGHVEGLSAGEAAFVGVLARYGELLESRGLVELGQAAAALARDSAQVFPRQVRVLAAQEVASSWIASRFLSGCPSISLEVDRSGSGIPTAPQGVEVRFALPSGALAEPGVIADIVRDRMEAGKVVVACKDPLKMFGQCQPPLAAEGASVAVQASKPFGRTDFGRAYLAMHHCLHDDPFDSALLADVAGSPFSGFSRAEALEVDKCLRADRIAGRDESCSALRAKSELFSQLEELASDPDADVLVGVFEQVAQAAANRDCAWKAEQLAAMAALKGAMAAARGARAGIDSCAAVLERASVRVSFKAGGDGPEVVFASQGGAARMGDGSCATLVAADLTTEDYPVSEREDAASTLLAKIGLSPAEQALDEARLALSSLLRVPTETVVLVRPLANEAAEPAYPAVALEEFIDTCCAAVQGGAKPDGEFGLPPDKLEDLLLRGEEELYANACALPAGARQAVRAEVPWPKAHQLGDDEARSCAPLRKAPSGGVLDKPCPSPSQIEAYLACPFQWFVNNRVRVEELDEGFGALERGSFAHAALETFYRAFQETGRRKVDEESLGEARILMRGVLDELKQDQFGERREGESRLVPRDELERREVEVLCRQLEGFLDYEVGLLPTFHPEHFEYVIDAGAPAEYAGAYLVGKVDRIDVDDRGRAVIIDYKGSVDSSYEIYGKGAANAGKVQTRIYAQAIKRELGLDVVGALYVTYGRNPVVSGAYDGRVLDAAHLPGINTRKCSCGSGVEGYDVDSEEFSFAKLSFEQVLDATEELAARAVAGMCSGEIAPDPIAGACRYCAVLGCPKRGA